MQPKSRVLIVMFAFTSAVGLASADSATAGDLHHKVNKMFKQLDANADGTLTRAEAGDSWVSKKFDKIDANQDGGLTVDEVVAFKKAHSKHGDCDKKPSRA
ncbi:MAG: hypothetical protein B7733_17065 [Myxococcales bacterium FL481]|nr:MAG: hypothetical protein B7733_17065 [Myxococcales bacterium FL481]